MRASLAIVSEKYNPKIWRGIEYQIISKVDAGVRIKLRLKINAFQEKDVPNFVEELVRLN